METTISSIPKNQTAGRLSIISHLLHLLDLNTILYCHWKSNEHLDASMTGDTDLDLLFDISQQQRVEALLGYSGFRRFEPIKLKKYADIEDYLGLDPFSGKLVHVHAHFRLTLGEPGLKGYQLDLEKKILDNRMYDTRFKIYRIHPAMEWTLLQFRTALKMRHRDWIRERLARKTFQAPANVLRELNWLRKECSAEDLKATLNDLMPGSESIGGLLLLDPSIQRATKIKRFIHRYFKDARLYSPAGSLIRRWYRELSLKIQKKVYRLTKEPRPLRRVYPEGGKIIAVIGADGSGKSTIIQKLQSTFQQKIDVYRIYFGRSGKKSILIKSLIRLQRFFSKRNNPALKNVATFFRCLEAMLLASAKETNRRRMLKARNRGMLVICDRYPQSQIYGYNDGPLLQELTRSGNGMFRSFAAAEMNFYRRFEKTSPDIVFKLLASVDVIESRKPGQTPRPILERKLEGIQQLEFGNGCRVINVNAALPLPNVLSIIKQEIWQSYH